MERTSRIVGVVFIFGFCCLVWFVVGSVVFLVCVDVFVFLTL